MSANNQVLIKEYKGKWYVFNNIMAESWSEKNELSIKRADAVCSTYKKASEKAVEFENTSDDFTGFNTEYGIDNVLIKDGANVTLFN